MIYSLQIPKYVQGSFDSTEIGMLQLRWGGGGYSVQQISWEILY